MKVINRIIFWLFAILLFFVPLILWPFTSEVFEFNKIVLVYILTTLITSTWIVKMIIKKKFLFRRTILDLPLGVFLFSQIISTIFSIDPTTSFFGYYSRFNGGLLSVICYAALFWAFVSNFNIKKALKLIYFALGSATLVATYGVLEHFGIDKNIWQQDVQSRVFSTLGQPNWLAAWLVALLPVVWALILNNKLQESNNKQNTKFKFQIKKTTTFLLSALFFTVLLFTGSRSGLLGFIVANLIFWLYILIKYKRKIIREFVICNLSFVFLALLIGTQWTPSLNDLIRKSTNKQITTQTGTTSLETGGTESGAIRKIVWKGALGVWLHYPIFGTGVETFAYSYYLYRPTEHNLTSEWDYIYNKAHNEYLNFAANSGTFGLIAYLALIGFAIYQMVKMPNKYKFPINTNAQLEELIIIGLLAGYISILVTNFFGFSVVPVQLEFFLFPAIAIVLAGSDQKLVISKRQKLSKNQKYILFIILIATGYLLITIGKYWYADHLYSTGKGYNNLGKPDVATKYLFKASKVVPSQPLYHSELASSYTSLALTLNQQKEATESVQFSTAAISEIQKAINYSPANINYRRVQFGVYVMLATINQNYLINARDTLITAIKQAPTDAKLYYNLALIYARTGQTEEALKTLVKTIELKANYKEARLAYSILLINNKQNSEAKTQLEYILNNIDPNDSLTKQALESVK